MERMVRYATILFALIILAVLLPIALQHVPAHGPETVGPPVVVPTDQARTAVLPLERGPGSGAAAADAAADAAPHEVVFDKRAKEQAVVSFDHLGHSLSTGLSIACTDCHHESEGTEVKLGCSMCHRSKHSGTMFSARAAQHKSCIGCHLMENHKAGELDKAPVACDTCHVPEPVVEEAPAEADEAAVEGQATGDAPEAEPEAAPAEAVEQAPAE